MAQPQIDAFDARNTAAALLSPPPSGGPRPEFLALPHLPGALSWVALLLSGVHRALALVPIVPFFPHSRHDVGLFVDPPPLAQDALTRSERSWRRRSDGRSASPRQSDWDWPWRELLVVGCLASIGLVLPCFCRYS